MAGEAGRISTGCFYRGSATYHVEKEHHDEEDETEQQLAEHVEVMRPLVRLGPLVVRVIAHPVRTAPRSQGQ